MAEKGIISKWELTDGALAANSTGRAAMDDLYLQNDKIANNQITANKLASGKVLATGVYGTSTYGTCYYG